MDIALDDNFPLNYGKFKSTHVFTRSAKLKHRKLKSIYNEEENMNNSSVEHFLDTSTCPRVVSTVLTATISFISIWAFIGNIMVTVAFLINVSLRTSTNYFIVNMAVSDLLSALTNWPLYAIEGMQSGKHLFEGSIATFVCKFAMYSRSISQAVSVLSLTLIVVDRFIAIVRPFHATRITKRCRAMLLLSTWLFSLSCGFPYIWFPKIVQEGRQTFCRFSWGKKELLSIFYTVGFVIFYCVPLTMITILYSKIMKCLRQTGPTDDTQQSVAIRNRQQNQIVMKVFISIVAAFFLCWTPLCVYLLLKVVFPSVFTKDSCMLFLGLFYYIFPSLSTAVNPVILFVSSSRFSKALRDMFCSLTCQLSCRRGVRVSPQREVIALQAAR